MILYDNFLKIKSKMYNVVKIVKSKNDCNTLSSRLSSRKKYP